MAKTLISIRLDNSLLAWLKTHAADGYQTKIQAVLKDYQQRCIRDEQQILGRAKQIFLQYHARCFWHWRKDLPVTMAHIPMIQESLRKYGGREGMRLACELDLTKAGALIDAAD